MDLIIIDSKLKQCFADAIANEVFIAFGQLHEINIIFVDSRDSALLKFTAMKDCYNIGSFVVIMSSENASCFTQAFPNNTVVTTGAMDDNEVRRISKQVIWMLNNFGRERKNMISNTWVISDSHFYHENIIKYCNRPYANAIEMNEDMIAKWNAVVGKDDIVWHLGDFCFGCKDHVKEIVPRLNGRINLVLGNHDHHGVSFYYESRFHRVYDHPVVVSDFFILSHEPLQWVKSGGVYANIYGHVHNQEMYKDATPNSFCACVERIGYAPANWVDVVEKMKASGNTVE